MPNWVDPLCEAHQHQTAFGPLREAYQCQTGLIRFARFISTKLC
jgi:hypothetical protein